MTALPGLVAAARRGLESAYGLALEGLGEAQIAAAVAATPGADPSDPRWIEGVLDRLPIDESWLFRDDDLWAWLRDALGPALRDAALARGRPIRALSLGCSTGQEAFSLAILLQGLAEAAGIPPSAAGALASVVGVDPSPARIAAARAGLVNGWSVQRCRPDWLRGKIALDDPATGRHRVDGSVRALCRFETGNLLALAAEGSAALAGYDLVLCRNVLIYFRAAEAQRLANALARALDPGAVLVVSAAEAHLLRGAGLAPLEHLGAARAGATGPGAGPFVGVSRAPRRTRRGTPAAAPRAPRDRSADGATRRDGAGPEDGHDLLARLLLGKRLLGVDAGRAREVLLDLDAAASRLPPDAAVPSADGLSVGQLAAAARLLLAGAGER